MFRVNASFSENFLVQIGLHRGSVLTTLIALSREIRSGCLDELFYADNLESDSEKLEGLKKIPEGWIKAAESKELRGNIKKIKMIISCENAGKVTIEVKLLCAIWGKCVGINSIPCQHFGDRWIQDEVAKIANLNVRYLQISKPTEQKIFQAYN